MADRILIIGIGNLLRSDDGVGIHAAQALAADPPPGVEVVDAGTDVLSALPFLESADSVLIIDAVQAGGAPGTIYRFAENEIPAQRAASSAHAGNLLAARWLQAPGTRWPEILILGVEPRDLDYGLDLSPPVAAILPRVLKEARVIVARWMGRQEIPAGFHEPIFCGEKTS